MDEVLIRSDCEGVCILTLNRPDQMNALSPELILSLGSAVEALAADETVRVVVLRGEGRAFCAGYDLKSRERARRVLPPNYTADTITALALLPKPVVAAVQGVCFTGGLELALACDFIIASTSARFADTHARWRMRAAWGLTQRLPRRVGSAMAKDMMMTGREVDGALAERIGLATRCVEDADLDREVQALSERVATFDPSVLGWIKHQVDAGAALPLGAALAHERTVRPGVAGETDAQLKASGWFGPVQGGEKG